MTTITTNDGTEIFYKDWGSRDAQVIHFHHGWPLSSDDWDAQMMFFLAKGYRVVAHDRRGHGRSSQSATGHDMDTYVADVIALADHLDHHNAIHVGHSTGGGEVARYVARAKLGQVVPFPTTGKLSAGIVRDAVLKSYPGYPHGMPTTNAGVINADLLAFVES